jgi:gamma-glutamyl hydrolase
MPSLRAAALSALLAGASSSTLRPIIGVLTLPNDLPPSLSQYTSYFPSSYASWLASGGARVAAVRFDAPAAETRQLLSSLNGAVLTGGGAAFFADDGSLTPYAATAQLLLDESLAAASRGETWPLWGTCLGHELALVLAAGPNRSVLSAGFDSENLALALTPTPAAATSRLWGSAPPEVWRWLTDPAENNTINLHVQGVTPEDFDGSALSRSFVSLSTNVDRAGREFVSSAEAKDAPIYTTQFHPEKPAYEFYPGYAIPHSDHAIHANAWTARFFVNESRKNSRSFATVEDENAALIYGTPPIFTAADPNPKLQVWEQIYAFWGGF